MRTLNRPMFKMGGPIKEGVMHGIREPHFKGQIVGKAMPHIQRGWRAFQGLFGNIGKSLTGGLKGLTETASASFKETGFGKSQTKTFLNQE